MWGQWIGRIDGTNKGMVTINIDRDIPVQARVLIVDDDQNNPSSCALMEFRQEGAKLDGTLSNFLPYNANFALLPAASPDLPTSGAVTATVSGNTMDGIWETNIDTRGTFKVTRYERDIGRPANYTMSWTEYKKWAFDAKAANPGLVFRGHKTSAYPLMTTLHRMGRRDLMRYEINDIGELFNHVVAITGTRFRREDPQEFLALLFLAQHHGFPTPLLDWTQSPYVAAFFAFYELEKTDLAPDKFIRIFSMDRVSWTRLTPQLGNIIDPRPGLTFQMPLPLGNARALPQQSIVAFSNISDIEYLIAFFQDKLPVALLTTIDIPYSDRDSAMKELSFMGITAANLFPGLEGACKALKERLF